MEIYDEESLKKVDITVENSNKEFDVNIKKLTDLKKSIENEMGEIDKRYEKVDNETTKSYEAKREKLIKEENELKEKLKNETTKIKEKLENSLSEVNNLLKISEKIIKGIKSLEKEEKIMFRNLSYVSQINKNQKKMKALFRELIKNLKISFVEEESTIKYEEYYFNGIPIPKNIEFKDVGTNSFNLSWKLDDINIVNIDKKEIKFRIEIRKENSNEKFMQIYEGNQNNYKLNKLEKNTNYEIRICSVYKDEVSDWAEIQKIKTKDLDSLILNGIDKGNEFLEKIYEWSGFKRMELIFRGTRDGSGSDVFHNKCDNQGPTICLFKNEKDNIFGAYASISWTSNSSYYAANGSFLFTLTNIYGIGPTKFPNNQNYDNAVYHNSGYGPTFGGNHDLYISSNCLNNNSSSSELGYSYSDILGKGNSIFSGNNNSNSFKLKEIEVFKLFN